MKTQHFNCKGTIYEDKNNNIIFNVYRNLYNLQDNSFENKHKLKQIVCVVWTISTEDIIDLFP
jgi:hypothetical protein